MKLIITALLLAGSAMATVTQRFHASPADLSGSGTVTIPSTTAHDAVLVFLHFRSNATDVATSIAAGSSTFTQAAGARASYTGPRAMDIWYCLDIAGGQTSLSITQSGTGVLSVTVVAYYSSRGVLQYSASGQLSNQSSGGAADISGPTLTTTGAGPVLGYFASATLTPTDVAAGSPWNNVGAGITDTHSNRVFYYWGDNAPVGVYTPQCHVSANGIYGAVAIALKEPAGAATARIPRRIVQ